MQAPHRPAAGGGAGGSSGAVLLWACFAALRWASTARIHTDARLSSSRSDSISSGLSIVGLTQVSDGVVFMGFVV